MIEHAQGFLDWVAAHPGPALALLFAVSMLDAIFIVGAFVPASIVLFGAGALVALGSVELWPTAALAALGALAGDSLSFWLGRRHGEALFGSRWLSRYPRTIANGREFFARHGAKGVVLARFLGPVRAVTPAIAGASGMPAWLFLAADGLAAYAWALVYILPGVVFGASLGLAAEVASRLAILLVLSGLTVVLGGWLSRSLIVALQAPIEVGLGRLLDWSRHHRRLGRFGAALADPSQPEIPVLASVAATLLLGSALWWWLLGAGVYPSAFDALVYQGLSDLQTPWGNDLAIAIAQLGDPAVYGPVAAAVLLALLARRKVRAAAHWIAALSFGALISLFLHALQGLPAPSAFYHDARPADLVNRDLVMVLAVYGFIPVLLATHRPARVGQTAYAVATVLIAQIVLAKLYLGVEWWGQTAFSIVIGLLWLSALGLGYRRHGAERLFARGFLVPVLLVFAAAAGLRWSADVPELERVPPPRALTLSADPWWNGGWRALPARRIDVRGEPGEPLDLQWAGELARIRAELTAAGWSEPAPLSVSNTLRWLTTSEEVGELPVLPKVHAGSHPALVMRKAIDGQTQWLVRLWPSGAHLDGGPPVWLGQLDAQTAASRFRLFRYPTEVAPGPVESPFAGGPRSRRVPGAAGPLWLLRDDRPG